MMAQTWRRVLVGKIDLDTVGAAFLAGVTRQDEVVVVRGGQADEADLADHSVLCIEVGGSGRVAKSNFDHHDAGGPTHSATMQVFNTFYRGPAGSGKGILSQWFEEAADKDAEACDFPSTHIGWGSECGWCWDPQAQGVWSQVEKLSLYIDTIDIKGPRALPGYGKLEFPGLSDVFAGILLTERSPVEQLHKGVGLFVAVLETGQDPFGTIRGFDSYGEAKAENNRQIAKFVEKARWEITAGGRRFAYLETDFIGAPGALYGQGAEIVVAYAPRFGNPPVPKFTIAGNGVVVTSALERLNALEQGWGGPATGTILGSPRIGSSLSLEEVVQIVLETL